MRQFLGSLDGEAGYLHDDRNFGGHQRDGESGSAGGRDD
jgi:hypothetical protein